MDNVVKIRSKTSDHFYQLSSFEMDRKMIKRLEICMQELNMIAGYLDFRGDLQFADHLRLCSSSAGTVSDFMRQG
jgi:hypothetical protein